MNVKELRIGNFVNTLDGDFQIEEINTFDYKVGLDGRIYNLMTVEPVLLTEEWLKKLGFVGRKDFMWKKQCGVQIIDGTFYFAFKDIGNVLFHSVVECRYVHSLQNCYFALTGEELELKEGK